ncbi:MAG TPA: hypothetical protein VNI83_02175 [Vicinamibacterales bacterium]|nr:hypothetical protein [Vicinamibacterales bacterium]
MAEKDNYWDEARGLWIDRATGNFMRPTDRGGDGIWYSPDGRLRYVNNTWVSNPTPPPWMPTAAGAGAGGTPLQLNPGYMYQLAQQEQAFQLQMQQVQQNFQAQQNELNRAFSRQMAETERRLQLELQRGNLDAQKYMQQRELAQREAEFARTLALQTLIAERDFQLRKVQEARQERLLQAQLAANPQDLVAYEFYKRSLGRPEAWDLAQQFAAGGDGDAQIAAAGGAGVPTETLSGEPYPEAPPAYSDEALQQLAASFYANTPGAAPLYNPNLAGEGVFGAQIQSPGAISRAQGVNLSDAEMGILASFLRAGVDMGGGKRVSINPDEYFQQVERSWIPTLSSVGTQTQYR